MSIYIYGTECSGTQDLEFFQTDEEGNKCDLARASKYNSYLEDIAFQFKAGHLYIYVNPISYIYIMYIYMCMYIYLYIYTYLYIYKYVYCYIYIYMHVYTYKCIYIVMYIYTYIYVYIYDMYISMIIYLYIYIHVYLHMYVYEYITYIVSSCSLSLKRAGSDNICNI